MTLEESLKGKDIQEEVKKNLTLVNVPYVSFEGETRTGQLVVHTSLAKEVQSLFKELADLQFPLKQITPIVAFNWDDDASMAANNTSAFNYRTIAGTTRLSHHATGRAIDLNPVLNPYVREAFVAPSGAVYDTTVRGTITTEIAELFKNRGWHWGGDWTTRKDWQHFEKPA